MMKYAFNLAKLPANEGRVICDIQSAADRLFRKLKNFNTSSLDISDYNKRYFQHIINNLLASLQLRTYILNWALACFNIPYKNIVLIDYGGGSGLLSLLAKELGIGTVIYNDIYDVSCHDAAAIAEFIGNKSDFYIQGEIGELASFLNQKSLSCHAIVSYDVIEHIYDVKGFFKNLHRLSDGSMSVVMASGANMLNPRQNRLLMKEQILREYKGREEKLGIKPTDCLQPFIRIRKEMIKAYLKELGKCLPEDQISKLSRQTRGLIQKDIYNCVDIFLKTHHYPTGLQHPTNTCNPYNGNWAEHLMDPYYLANLLAETGFCTKILNGYYGKVHHKIKSVIGPILNVGIYLLGRHGIRLAPFYTIYGTK